MANSLFLPSFPPVFLRSAWPLTGVIRTLRARSPKKVEKKVRGGPLGPGVKKGWKKVEKSWKKVVFDSFLTFFRLFFQPFLTRGREAPGNLFSTFLGFRARRARMTPVRGQGDRNSISYFSPIFLLFSGLLIFYSIAGRRRPKFGDHALLQITDANVDKLGTGSPPDSYKKTRM